MHKSHSTAKGSRERKRYERERKREGDEEQDSTTEHVLQVGKFVGNCESRRGGFRMPHSRSKWQRVVHALQVRECVGAGVCV